MIFIRNHRYNNFKMVSIAIKPFILQKMHILVKKAKSKKIAFTFYT